MAKLAKELGFNFVWIWRTYMKVDKMIRYLDSQPLSDDERQIMDLM